MSLPERSQHADNADIAQRLREAAEILEAQRANPFRVGAYRNAASALEQHPQSVSELYAAHGREGLDALPGIGPGLAAAIAEMIDTGRWAQLDRLRGTLDPATLFRTVPGIGPETAERIHDVLGIDSLEALEAACHDGTLARIPGIGARRVAAIRAVLAERLDRSRLRRRLPPAADAEPGVDVLLDVDREYRERSAARTLATIAPRRFNPAHEAWLPVLHARRGDWHFTALFSNTAKAHELGRTRDWVVVYFDGDRHAERQRTIVTEQRGALAGRRIVRGRESECRAHYEAETAAA